MEKTKTTRGNYELRLSEARLYMELTKESFRLVPPKPEEWTLGRFLWHFFTGGMFLVLGIMFSDSLYERNYKAMVQWIDNTLEQRDHEVQRKILEK
jgi:hypothetical protein